MILNCIELYDFECNWIIWLKFYKEIKIDIFKIFILSWLFVNKSLTISIFAFWTAKYNAVS